MYIGCQYELLLFSVCDLKATPLNKYPKVWEQRVTRFRIISTCVFIQWDVPIVATKIFLRIN